MKRLVCEICGSSEIRKDNGVFVCQACGCQYSTEDVRKMLVEVEGTVEVTGTVMVDNTPYVEKYLANARRAREKEDWEEVEKYYNMVEQNDPDNIEAIFFSAYGKAMVSLTDSDIYKRQAAFKVLANSISVIDDHYMVDRWEENRDAIIGMTEALVRMVNSSFVYEYKVNGYGTVVSSDSGKTFAQFRRLLVAFKESIDNIQRVDDCRYLHEALVQLCEGAMLANWPSASDVPSMLASWISEEKASIDELTGLSADLYWMLNPQAQAEYQAELSSLMSRGAELTRAIENTPEAQELAEFSSALAERKKQLGSLGAFSRRKKAAIEKEISDLTLDIEDIKEELLESTGSMQQELDDCIARQEAIQAILARGEAEYSGRTLSDYRSRRDDNRNTYLRTHPGAYAEYKSAMQAIEEAKKERGTCEQKLERAKYLLDQRAIDDANDKIAECDSRIARSNESIARLYALADAEFITQAETISHFASTATSV